MIYYIYQLLGNFEFVVFEIIFGNFVFLILDMWSVGVFIYVFFSGVFFFLDDSVEEICLNICCLDFSFLDDYFKGVSQKVKEFVCFFLQEDFVKCFLVVLVFQEQWLQVGNGRSMGVFDMFRLIFFIERCKYQNDV